VGRPGLLIMVGKSELRTFFGEAADFRVAVGLGSVAGGANPGAMKSFRGREPQIDYGPWRLGRSEIDEPSRLSAPRLSPPYSDGHHRPDLCERKLMLRRSLRVATENVRKRTRRGPFCLRL
jgi:hypothetical protein